MESLKLKNDKYWDTSGVFDHQELKTQEEINAIFKNEFNEVVVGASIGPISIATFDASAADMPLKGLTVNIEPVQSGSGDPSPDNVRPITGWTGCTVLYPGLDITRDLAIVRNKYINTSGVETDATTDFSHTDYFSVTPGETLYFSSYWDELPSSAQSIVFYDVNKVFKTRKWLLSSENQNKGHIGYNFKAQTVADGCYYAILNFNYDLRDRMVLTDKDPTISFPSPDPGTVYGGTLDVVNGKLTVDRASVDLGTLTWEKTSGGFFQTQKSRIGAKTGTTAPLLCSCYPYRSTGRDKFIAQTSSNICIVDSTYADLETFVSAITGQTMVYPLASPVPYDLTAEQITTLLGTNNIWADCGDVTVTYGAYLETVKAYADQVAEVAPFYAEYFVTTKEEIEAAINNKRQIFLRPNRYNSQFAQFAGSFWYIESPASFGVGSSGTGYRFITTIGESQTVFELKSSWSYRNYDLSAPADRAEAAADQAEAALANIPADYTELVNDVDNLKSAVAPNANFTFVSVVSKQYPAPYNALDTIFGCGLYGVRGSEGYMPDDAPAGFAGGALLILPAYQERTSQGPRLNQTQKVQMLIDPINKKIWMRYSNASNVWRDWFVADMSMPVTALATATPNASGFTSSSFVTGGISEAGSNSSNSHRIRSVYIAKGGKTSIRYAIPDGYRLQIAFYSNNSGTQVSRTNWMTGEGRIGFPNSATYFRLQFASIGDSIDLTPANDYDRIAISYGYKLIDHPPYITTPTKWLAVGDSITYGVCSSGANASSVGTGWARFLANSLGYTMYNMGVRGMGYVTAGSNGITWADTLDNIDALTDDYNLITIMLGINDYNNSSATLDSIADALNTGITRIITKYPNARLVVFTPFNARNRGTAETLYDYGYGYPTSNPRTLKDIADKIMEVCAQRGIECHNVSNGCLLHPGNMTGLLLDSIHPSQDCHMLLSKAMARYLIY